MRSFTQKSYYSVRAQLFWLCFKKLNAGVSITKCFLSTDRLISIAISSFHYGKHFPIAGLDFTDVRNIEFPKN